MKIITMLLISLSLFGYSTQELTNVINSDKEDSIKVKEVLRLDQELKNDIKQIQNFKQQYIKKYKKIAVKTMKDKTKTNYEKMTAWNNFASIAEGTKYAKSGKLMAKKFSKKANKDLTRELKTEELKVDRDYNKIVSILDKILNLNLRNKEKAKYEKKRDIYYLKIDKNIKKDESKKSVSKIKQVNKIDDKKVVDIKETKKEEKRKSLVSHKHELTNKQLEDFRAPVFNKNVVKEGTLDISNYVGIDAAEKKKLLLLTFYANYCKPCKKELPFLNKLYKKYKDQGFLVVAVNTDKDKEERKKVEQFISDKQLKFPVLKDSYGLVSRRYRIENFPTMFLINSSGKIIEVTIGYDEDEEGLENKIKNLLK